jgi:hypothetical protein
MTGLHYRLTDYWLRLGRISFLRLCLPLTIAFTGCVGSNFMTGAPHQDPNAGYIAGYNADMDSDGKAFRLHRINMRQIGIRIGATSSGSSTQIRLTRTNDA